MKLRTKLLVAQSPNALALALLGWLAVRSVATLGTATEIVLQENYRSVEAVQRMREALERIDSGTLLLLLGRGAPGVSRIREHMVAFEAELSVARGNITEAGEPETVVVLLPASSATEKVAALVRLLVPVVPVAIELVAGMAQVVVPEPVIGPMALMSPRSRSVPSVTESVEQSMGSSPVRVKARVVALVGDAVTAARARV